MILSETNEGRSVSPYGGLACEFTASKKRLKSKHLVTKCISKVGEEEEQTRRAAPLHSPFKPPFFYKLNSFLYYEKLVLL